MIYVVKTISEYENTIVTNDFTKMLETVTELSKDKVLTGAIPVEIWSNEGKFVDKFVIPCDQDRESIEKSFVLLAAQTAQRYPTESNIVWAKNIIKQYDSENPTLNSLIYTLYMKYKEKNG